MKIKLNKTDNFQVMVRQYNNNFVELYAITPYHNMPYNYNEILSESLYFIIQALRDTK